MDILENKAQWAENYRQGWLSHLEQTGEVNWKIYQHPRNNDTPGVPGIDLRRSRLLFVTSAGAYLRHSQRPFDAPSLYGDYTLRTFPASTSFTDLAYAHDHYDHTMINQDPQAALPLRFLEEMVADGRLGELAPSVISFMGYQPDSARVVNELIPEVVAAAKAEKAQAALLAPV
jgi:D-proline reductase (dithiol) PrdB